MPPIDIELRGTPAPCPVLRAQPFRCGYPAARARQAEERCVQSFEARGQPQVGGGGEAMEGGMRPGV